MAIKWGIKWGVSCFGPIKWGVSCFGPLSGRSDGVCLTSSVSDFEWQIIAEDSGCLVSGQRKPVRLEFVVWIAFRLSELADAVSRR